jgi:ubiquinone biosynthesis protein COQ9
MTKSKLNDSIEQEKLLILTKFLKEAPFDRWSESNLKKSARTCGFDDGYVALLFPNNIDDLTEYFNQLMNKQMIENFTTKPSSKISEKIAQLIELKLALYLPHREAIRSLLQYNLMPQNLCKAQKSLWETCDQIWHLAGDQSTDHNYYTKRALLAGVYSSSLLYWLADESANQYNTKAFIKRKIQDVGKFSKWKSSLLSFFKNL